MSDYMSSSTYSEEVKSNSLLGIVGALAGALTGAVLWVVLYQAGIVASIAGIAIITLACKGYDLLSRRLDGKGIVFCIIIAVLVLTASHFLCWGFEIYDVFKEEYAITLMDAIVSVPEMVYENDLLIGFVRDLMIGLVLIGVGVTPYIKKILHERNMKVNG